MREPSSFVGLDVHKNQIAVAMVLPNERTPVEWRIAASPPGRLGKFLLRRGRVYCVGRRPTWSQKYRGWLRGLTFERSADQTVFEDCTTGTSRRWVALCACDDEDNHPR